MTGTSFFVYNVGDTHEGRQRKKTEAIPGKQRLPPTGKLILLHLYDVKIPGNHNPGK